MQTGFAFPQPLTEKYKPATIDAFVGLEKPKKIMRSLAANPRPVNLLLRGPSGVGKTSMAFAFASQLGAETHHISSQNCNMSELERITRNCWYVPKSGGWHVVIVDEADCMSDAAQKFLLSKLDGTDRPPQTIYIFTCNAVDRLEDRFLSRCLQLEFSSYGIASDAASFLQSIWDAEVDSPTERPNFARIVKDSTNNIREALMRLEPEIMSN